MTALDIMSQARERLGDLKKQRWTNNRLLSIVSQGQVDICVESGYLRKQVILPLINDIDIYTLPSDCVSVKRVEYNGVLLPLHDRSDEDVPRAITSDYTAYKSNLNTGKLEIQPAPEDLVVTSIFVMGDTSDDSFQVTPLYGVVTRTDSVAYMVDPVFGTVTNITSDVIGNEPSVGYGEISGQGSDSISQEFPNGEYGVVIGASYNTTGTKYGFITQVNNHKVSGLYGVTTSVTKDTDTFMVYYTAAPAKLRYESAILVIPEVWEDLLLRYVVGTALQDDNDANNIQRGELELAKYEKKLNTIQSMSAKDFSSAASDKFTTSYRRI